MNLQNLRIEPIDHVLEDLQTSTALGLCDAEVVKRQKHYGLNLLKEKKTHPFRDFLISQLKDPIIIILLAAAIIKYFSEGIKDCIAILFVIILNTTLGLIQQKKAENSLKALKVLINPKASVLRQGLRQDVDSKELVPGDIVFLESGMKVPADARIIESHQLVCDESLLTGESYPVLKNTTTSVHANMQPQDFNNCVFSGTIAVKGRATAVVIGTGSNTEIGKIATSLSDIDDTPSPLQIKLKQFSQYLSYGVIALIIVMSLIGLLKGYGLKELFMVAVSLIVSAIPEGLPVAITLCLVIGIKKMAEKNALVKKLASVETLGSTTVICSDKTGTLTCNQMTVTHVVVGDKILTVSGTGYDFDGHIHGDAELRHLSLNAAFNHESSITVINNKARIQGDPTEAALIVLSKKIPITEGPTTAKVIIPFESEHRYMASLITENENKNIYIKGALDQVLKFCNRMQDSDGKILPVNFSQIEKIAQQMSQKQLRIIAFAHIPLQTSTIPHQMQNAIFDGFACMEDPLRPHIHETIKKCEEAQIQVKMITGDHPHTAEAIFKQMKGHGSFYLLKGADIDQMSENEKQTKLFQAEVFARVSPHNKLEIVNAIKNAGHIVAMTGDGVNDAPSLKGADIGIAMGSGSDVAKETASIILLDDNFVTLVKAIEMGRMIYITLQNLIVYLLMTALSGVLTICFAIFLTWPLPLLPIQLLWINLVTDGSTTIPMIFEKMRASLMKQKPIPQNAPIIDRQRLYQLCVIGSLMSFGSLGLFYFSWHIRNDNLAYAQTMAFTALALFQIFNAQNVRSKDEGCLFTFRYKDKILKRIPFSYNKPLLLTMCMVLFLQYTACQFSFIQPFLKTVSLTLSDWLLITFSTFSIILISDFFKWIRFRKQSF